MEAAPGHLRIGADQMPTRISGEAAARRAFRDSQKNIPPSPRQSCRTTMSAPQASLSDLRRADGSATFSQNGYSVLCAVNGPLEVQRRDELPEEAAIEVNVRPASGVGSKHALY